jgi:nitrate reductase gamma subunit
MSLLEFARGPALQWSLIIFVAGVLWRLSSLLLLNRRKDFSAPRRTNTWWGGLRTIVTRSWPDPAFSTRVQLQNLMGYIFHIGWAITLLFFVPHIDFFYGLTGLYWPGLPNNIAVLAGALTILAMLVLLVHRLTSGVLRLLSGFDDYFSWFVTIAPVLTGLMAYARTGPRYETMLGIHILSFDLLLLWFPFGKLMHAFLVFPSRATEGAAFERKGVEA